MKTEGIKELILEWLLSNSPLIALIGAFFFIFVKFALPKVFDRYLELRTSKAIEEFKSDLETKRTKEISIFQDSVQNISFERETLFASLHHNQEKVIPEIYAKVMDIEATLEYLTAEIKPDYLPEERLIKNAVKNLKEFAHLYQKNEMYFSDDMCKTFYDLNTLYRGILNNYIAYRQSQDPLGDEEKIDKRQEYREKVRRKFNDEAIPKRVHLRRQFRKLLGLPEEDSLQREEALPQDN